MRTETCPGIEVEEVEQERDGESEEKDPWGFVIV
jgi:hypothetical protein